MTLKEGIIKLKQNQHLTQEEAYHIFKSLATDDFSPEEVELFLELLRQKGETWQEITGAALAYREVMTKLPFNPPEGAILVDTCGTGGDAKNSFNFSTAVAIALSSVEGVYVAKHGNRSVSSQSGSADLLEASGIPLDLSPEASAQALTDLKFTFLFAPLYHPAFKKVIPIRQKLGRTIFNLLGPLLNPASPTHQLMGVYSYVMTEKIAYVLDALKVKRALVVFGEEGFDEVTITGSTKISELRDERITTYFLDPEDFGFERCENLEELQVKSPQHSLEILEKLFKNQLEGPVKDMFLLNLGAALYLCEKAIDIRAGVEKAKELVRSRQIWDKWQEIKNYYRNLKN